MRSFGGFPPEALTFFRGLARNNRREWFQPRKQIFEEKVKTPMVELITVLGAHMIKFAPGHVTEPEKAMYRIYRDTRFSNDKTPYKTRIAANFPRRGMPKHASASYYFSVSHTEIEVAGGIYLPGPEELLAVRTHLAARHEEFRRLLASRGLRAAVGELQGEQLTRVPKGFCSTHPAADLLRYKQFLFYVVLDPSLATTRSLETELLKRFRAMAPFIEFLNAPLVHAARKPKKEIFG